MTSLTAYTLKLKEHMHDVTDNIYPKINRKTHGNKLTLVDIKKSRMSFLTVFEHSPILGSHLSIRWFRLSRSLLNSTKLEQGEKTTYKDLEAYNGGMKAEKLGPK